MAVQNTATRVCPTLQPGKALSDYVTACACSEAAKAPDAVQASIESTVAYQLAAGMLLPHQPSAFKD